MDTSIFDIIDIPQEVVKRKIEKIEQEHDLELPYALKIKLPKNFKILLFTNIYFRCRFYAVMKNLQGDNTFYFSSRQDGVNVARYMKRMEDLGIVEMIKKGEKNVRSNTYKWLAEERYHSK